MKLTPQKSTVLGLIIVTQKVKFSVFDHEFSLENPNADSIHTPIDKLIVDTLKVSSSNVNFNIILPSMTRYLK